MEVMEVKERLPKETKGKAEEKNHAWDEVQSVLNKEEVEEVYFLQPYLHLLSPSLIELLRFCETTRARNTYLTREVVLLENISQISKNLFENMGIKIACTDPTKIPFERLIEIKKKLFMLGFTVEGFKQIGGVDCVINIETDEEGGDEDVGEEDQVGCEDDNHENKDKKDLFDEDPTIDELDKFNFRQEKYGRYSGKSKAFAFYYMNHSDSDQENFIMECAAVGGIPPWSLLLEMCLLLLS
ncbi:hypothetical protein D1007_30891 [Hordeum vulgare]|nr:hypothetical protein D1007_30891 [Hordeum vulgare]